MALLWAGARTFVLAYWFLRGAAFNTFEPAGIDRLSDGAVRSLETSTIHLDTIRDLKQINSLLASIAYPVLAKAGQLRTSRLL